MAKIIMAPIISQNLSSMEEKNNKYSSDIEIKH